MKNSSRVEGLGDQVGGLHVIGRTATRNKYIITRFRACTSVTRQFRGDTYKENASGSEHGWIK